MTNETDISDRAPWELVLVTGPSGAGRSTAINALEDIGYETIDNLPLSLLPRLLDGEETGRPLALGIDVRNRDFSESGLLHLMDSIAGNPKFRASVIYLDCQPAVLQRRYSETRRRHPLSPEDAPLVGITAEIELLKEVRSRSDNLIDTSDLSPHDLKAEIAKLFDFKGASTLAVTVESFSYKRGVPRGADMVFDCRFLKNPHWEETLRPLDGRDPRVGDYVASDENYAPFRDKVIDLAAFLLPAYREEGKAHFTIAFGCTGGKHRSVSLTETVFQALADQGWQVSKRHRELERNAAVLQRSQRGMPK